MTITTIGDALHCDVAKRGSRRKDALAIAVPLQFEVQAIAVQLQEKKAREDKIPSLTGRSRRRRRFCCCHRCRRCRRLEVDHRWH